MIFAILDSSLLSLTPLGSLLANLLASLEEVEDSLGGLLPEPEEVLGCLFSEAPCCCLFSSVVLEAKCLVSGSYLI